MIKYFKKSILISYYKEIKWYKITILLNKIKQSENVPKHKIMKGYNFKIHIILVSHINIGLQSLIYRIRIYPNNQEVRNGNLNS